LRKLQGRAQPLHEDSEGLEDWSSMTPRLIILTQLNGLVTM
jgi:hypothetical protein